MSSSLGTLWVVATPLGNPGDLSPRAREVLASVDSVLAEDTRRTGQLFSRCGMASPHFVSLHDHNEEGRVQQVLARLQAGESLALVSDAGTPLMSDPGFRLVKACRDAGVRVSPVPGPCAPIAALSASGLPPQPFAFLGFPPRKSGEREEFFAPYAGIAMTLVFFERKDRLRATLADAYASLGQRDVCIARELTKTYEDFIYLTLEDHALLPEELLGEITVVVGPPRPGTRSDEAEVDAVLEEERRVGGKPRDVAARAKLRLHGWTAKDLYRRLLS